jgi:hypothetical protein
MNDDPLAARIVSRSEQDTILRQIGQDEADGFFVRSPINQGDHFAKATAEVAKQPAQ